MLNQDSVYQPTTPLASFRSVKRIPLRHTLFGATLLLFFAVAALVLLLKTVETSSEDWISRADQLTSTEIRVVVIQYFPEKSGSPGYIDDAIVGSWASGMTIAQVRNNVASYTQTALGDLEDGSAYHAYSIPEALPYINYTQYGAAREYIEPLPLGLQVPWNPSAYRADFIQVLGREDICTLVDVEGVDQIWLWGYHHGTMEPVESNMQMGTVSQAWWNHGTYGDISNSEQTNDMPQCDGTYVLYNYNYSRAVGEVLEDHTHQLERYFNFLQEMDPAEVKAGGTLFWNKWVGANTGASLIANPGCGWTHFTPNSTLQSHEYNWYLPGSVLSDCMDWKPDGTGVTTAISCETWAGEGSGCPDDGGRKFKVWWMRSLPGENHGLSYLGYPLKNWWDAVINFDIYLANGGGLVGPIPTPTPTSTPTPTPTPSPDPTPTPTPSPDPTPTPTPSPDPTPTPTPDPTPTPTPTPTAQPEPTATTKTKTRSTKPKEPRPPVCESRTPGTKTPQIYAALTESSTSISLYFTPADPPFSHYALVFGTAPDSYRWGIPSFGDRNSRILTIAHLEPNTRYYFRLIAINSCAPGNWSDELSGKTSYVISNQNSPSPSENPEVLGASTTASAADAELIDQLSEDELPGIGALPKSRAEAVTSMASPIGGRRLLRYMLSDKISAVVTILRNVFRLAPR